MHRTVLVLPALLLVAACGGTGAASDNAATPMGEARSGQAASASSAGSGGGPTRLSARGPAHGRPATMQRAVISRGELELQARDVARARDDVLRLLHRWDGQVSHEETGADPHGRMTSVSLELRVPSADFDTAMTELAGVARTVHQQISSEDVTTQVIDVNARVRAKEDALRRIEALLAHARNLGQIIAIETDLGNRQAELDSLKQQQAWLRDQTSLSTIDMSIDRTAPPVHHRHQAQGLLAGLATGWHALVATAVALLTVVGVALPFVLVLGVVVVPLWVWWRRSGRKPVLRGPVDAG